MNIDDMVNFWNGDVVKSLVRIFHNNMMVLAVASLILCGSAVAGDADQKVSYWYAETDSTGWVLGGGSFDFSFYVGTHKAQPDAVNNIALDDYVLRNGVLVRPNDPRRTRILNYDSATAGAWINTNLPSYGSIKRTCAILFADYAVDNLVTVGADIADTITVMRTVVDSAGMNVTTPIAGFRRSQ